MIIYLVGVSCVGKSTLGKLLANAYNFKFIDFDYEVMDTYHLNIDAIKREFEPPLSDREYRNFVSPILDHLLYDESDNMVIAMPPSGLFPEYKNILDKHKDILTVELVDYVKSILNRLIYFDEDRKIWPIRISRQNRLYYENELKEDLKYYGQVNKSAMLKVHLSGKGIDDALAILDKQIKKWLMAHKKEHMNVKIDEI
jgi:shikimate kinase